MADQRYHVLVEFAYKHTDFHRAELESVLDLYGIQVNSSECQILSLPTRDDSETDANPAAAVNASDAVAKASKPKDSASKNLGNAIRPFLILSFPSDSRFARAATQNRNEKSSSSLDIGSIILGRCTLVRSVVELWGCGTSLESCAQATKAWIQNTVLGQTVWKQNAAPSHSWKVTVHTLGSKYTPVEQEAMRAQFAFLNLPGPVLMKDPTNEFVLIREIELDANGGPLYPRHSGPQKTLNVENDKRPPLACYFGRVMGQRSVKGRGGVQQYSLKKRSYLGPTSMDAELAFVMTNLGQVRPGTVAFDPFVGTGSILLACALRGAYCMGTDIDIRVLKGKGNDENVYANFRQFDLPRPELIRSDNAIYHRHYRCDTPLYQSIICDPPYGIRAGARKTGSRRASPRPILEQHRHDHIPQTRPYEVSDVMADLLDMAARTLVLGGRLVYIIPSFSDFVEEADLPRHECLETVHICYQPLSLELGRRMVAMKKVKDYDPSKRELYMASVWKNGAESAEKCARIRDKILEAAKRKPCYEEKLAHRKQKRKMHKEAKKKARLEVSNDTER